MKRGHSPSLLLRKGRHNLGWAAPGVTLRTFTPHKVPIAPNQTGLGFVWCSGHILCQEVIWLPHTPGLFQFPSSSISPGAAGVAGVERGELLDKHKGEQGCSEKPPGVAAGDAVVSQGNVSPGSRGNSGSCRYQVSRHPIAATSGRVFVFSTAGGV